MGAHSEQSNFHQQAEFDAPIDTTGLVGAAGSSEPSGAIDAHPTDTAVGPQRFSRYVALGDSFTEGVGDEQPDGSIRGWADLVASQVADEYANFAVRGKLLGAIVDEQLDAALALRPDLVTIAAGGNDMLRPRADLVVLRRILDLAVARLCDTGATVIMFTGADPSDNLPMGRMLRAHGDEFGVAARQIAKRRGALLADMWQVRELRDARYWSEDRLHLNGSGHSRVAAMALDVLGIAGPSEWTAAVSPLSPPEHPLHDRFDYYRQYVGPWIKRRLTGTSSGDHRPPKRPEPTPPTAV